MTKTKRGRGSGMKAVWIIRKAAEAEATARRREIRPNTPDTDRGSMRGEPPVPEMDKEPPEKPEEVRGEGYLDNAVPICTSPFLDHTFFVF
jgi:hypothetical protein